ncbi:MAG TPA: phosphatase PAP2 family protein [Longimicrobiales bacterium]|nr:phosphatase PAP2 family protein [Longimicrobiales bacterium]
MNQEIEEVQERRTRPRGPTRRAGDALYGVLRFIAGHVRGFYGAILTYLSFSFFVGLAAVGGFAVMADEVLEGGTQRFDEAVLTWVATHRTEALDQVALEVTALGNTATLAVLVLAVASFLWLTHHRYSVLLLFSALAGGAALNWLLKDIFARPRPTVVEWGTEVASASFPSGHAMSAMVAYASVAYLGGRLEPTRVLRLLTWLFAAVIILGIGGSRIYLGVHYPSDVLAGFIAGAAWTAFVVSGITALRYFSTRKPEVVAEERDLHAEAERELGLRE